MCGSTLLTLRSERLARSLHMNIASAGKTKFKEQGAQNVYREKVFDQHLEDGEKGQCCQYES
jgi:hypothetical protein